MGIHDFETVEGTSPVRRRYRRLRTVLPLLMLLIGAAALAVALSPRLRRLLLSRRDGQVTLAIGSTPKGADVFIDERPVGTTPTRVSVAPGLHEVRIVARGHRPWRQTVDTAVERRIDPKLDRLELATLVIESDPARAGVFLDDDYRGVTPLRLANVEAGAHTIRLTKEPLFRPHIAHIELKTGETRTLKVKLESGLESLYLGRIKEQPKKLSNYTELLHLYVINEDAPKALAVMNQAIETLKVADSSPTELRQFFDELSEVHRGRLGGIDEPTRQKVLDTILLLFEKLVLTNPSEPAYYQPIVSLLGQTGHFADIQRICEKTAEDPKARGVVHTYVAQMYLNWGEPKCAIMLLERAVELQPTLFSAQYYLGSAYHRAERYDDALKHYEAAEKVADDTSLYYQGLVQTGIARLLAAKGDVAGATARFKKALALNVESYYSHQWRLMFAEMLAENGRKQEAIEQYREVDRLSPGTQFGQAARRALHHLEGK